MLEFIAHLVGDQPGGDGHDGRFWLQIVFQQGLAGFYNIYDHVAEAQNRGDFDG